MAKMLPLEEPCGFDPPCEICGERLEECNGHVTNLESLAMTPEGLGWEVEGMEALRAFIEDCKETMAQPLCPRVEEKTALELAGWYEKLWVRGR